MFTCCVNSRATEFRLALLACGLLAGLFVALPQIDLAVSGFFSRGAGLWALPAEAHVKWFAPYIVDAAPQPISATLTNVWFWTGIGLVLAFFLATLFVERTSVGRGIQLGLDRVSAPLWNRGRRSP